MQLIELAIFRGDELIRKIPFKDGLNLILDKPSLTRTDSGNSIGKTTVLRLIDFCLGSDGDDIWQDAEFKSVNQEVYDFLHGQIAISVRLELDLRGRHVLRRSFGSTGGAKAEFWIDDTPSKNVKEYRSSVKEILFGASGSKPSLRQLIPKFVRTSPTSMSKTLKLLGDYGSETDYEALHLFLFGFTAVDVLEQRPKLATHLKSLQRDLQALNRLRTEGEIEQLLIHLRRQIQDISLSSRLRGEVPEIRERAETVSAVRAEAARAAGLLSRFQSEAAALGMAVSELKSEYGAIDRQVIESIYREAQNYIPKLHHDWNDLTDFIQNLRGRKERFLESQIADLRTKADAARGELLALQNQEMKQIGDFVKSPEFQKALELRSDLQEKLMLLGSLEQSLEDLKQLKSGIATVEGQLEETRALIEKEKETLGERVGIFNKYFSELSKSLYGEQYLLVFDETSRGSISFQLRAVGSNVGAGKKTSQTAAFDLAYIEFLRETGLNFPTFVCHDRVEGIHGNQLSALLIEADKLDGQLILTTLRDKLPPMPKGFVDRNTILELSQENKLFQL